MTFKNLYQKFPTMVPSAVRDGCSGPNTSLTPWLSAALTMLTTINRCRSTIVLLKWIAPMIVLMSSPVSASASHHDDARRPSNLCTVHAMIIPYNKLPFPPLPAPPWPPPWPSPPWAPPWSSGPISGNTPRESRVRASHPYCPSFAATSPLPHSESRTLKIEDPGCCELGKVARVPFLPIAVIELPIAGSLDFELVPLLVNCCLPSSNISAASSSRTMPVTRQSKAKASSAKAATVSAKLSKEDGVTATAVAAADGLSTASSLSLKKDIIPPSKTAIAATGAPDKPT